MIVRGRLDFFATFHFTWNEGFALSVQQVEEEKEEEEEGAAAAAVTAAALTAAAAAAEEEAHEFCTEKRHFRWSRVHELIVSVQPPIESIISQSADNKPIIEYHLISLAGIGYTAANFFSPIYNDCRLLFLFCFFVFLVFLLLFQLNRPLLKWLTVSLSGECYTWIGGQQRDGLDSIDLNGTQPFMSDCNCNIHGGGVQRMFQMAPKLFLSRGCRWNFDQVSIEWRFETVVTVTFCSAIEDCA